MKQSELIEYLKTKIADEVKAVEVATNDLNITFHEARLDAFSHVVDFLNDITISEKE